MVAIVAGNGLGVFNTSLNTVRASGEVHEILFRPAPTQGPGGTK
jgi:hypothetical protein